MESVKDMDMNKFWTPTFFQVGKSYKRSSLLMANAEKWGAKLEKWGAMPSC